MLLDLWTFSSVTNDVLDLVTHLHDNGTFSFGLLFCCFVFLLITYIVWRSTDIPQDVPSAPAPPFVITIQNSSNVGGLRRQNLSDIRVISPATYTDFVHRYPFARVGRSLVRAHNISRTQSGSTQAQGTPDSVSAAARQTSARLQQAGRSFVLGFLRHPLAVTRGLAPIPARLVLSLFPPSIFLAGRAHRQREQQQRRHHNRQQSHGHRDRPQSPTPESPENQIVASAAESQNQNLSQSSIDALNRRNVDILNSTELAEEVIAQESARNVVNTEGSHHQTTTMDDIEGSEVLGLGLPANPRTENILEGDTDEAKTSESQESVTTTTNPHSTPSDSPSLDSLPEVKFTLKFLNDTQIEVNTHSGEKIGDFKRRHFTRELSENKIVRLIFNGRVLDQDNRTLQECGIFDHCVVHCLVVTPQQPTSAPGSGGSASTRFGERNSNNRAGQRGPEPGMFFMSFVGIILMFMWFICINFGNHLFTQSAVVSLSILTLMFVAGIFTFYAPFQQQNNNNVNANT